MSDRSGSFDEPLQSAHRHATSWLASEPHRAVPPHASAAEIVAAWNLDLPENPTDATTVVDDLAARAEPGLMASSSGRFFGWVIGGVLPASLAADWLVSAWDQNAGMRLAAPAMAAVEDCAGRWLLDLLHLPSDAAVGFTTGATAANVVGLTAARRFVLDRVGWNVDVDGLQGAPRVTVLAGQERHTSVDIALRYLGFGVPKLVSSDSQGRIDPEALGAALADVDGPAIVCLQAGNLHSGAVDPMRESMAAAHARGAWVHVDGAFGLWAAAVPAYAEMLDGIDGADSWATDAHKTLNVPYD